MNKCPRFFRGMQPGSLSLYQNLGKSPPQTFNPFIDGKSLSFEGEVDLRQPKDIWASLVAQLAKNLPAVQETWVWSLGWEDPLEKETATHSNILAWRIPWTVYSMGLQRVRYDWVTFISLVVHLLAFQTEISLGKSFWPSLNWCSHLSDFMVWYLFL